MAIDNPTISGYRPFYLYRASDGLKETRSQWGFIAKANPYPALPTPKEPYGVDYPDSNGKEEYVSSLYYESQEVEVQFYIRAKDSVSGGVTTTSVEEIRSRMASFFAFVKNGEFSYYDSYTGLGRQKVRFAGYAEEQFHRRGDTARCVFTIKFKVNDPCTFMRLDNDSNPTKIEAIV